MPRLISSLQNPLVKRTLWLRKSSERRKQNKFLIDGLREIQLAIDHGFHIETLFFAQATQPPVALPDDRLCEVPPSILEKISYGQRGADFVAVARGQQLTIESLTLSSSSWILVLDRTEKPGNLGSVLRTASAVGISAVILTNPICEVFNPNAIRASRGTVFTVPIAVADTDSLERLCAELQIPLACAVVQATQSMWQQDFRGGCALVFGNEADGLDPAAWGSHRPNQTEFTIPMEGAADSLNLSNSAAIVLYEAYRQRSGGAN